MARGLSDDPPGADLADEITPMVLHGTCGALSVGWEQR
jgi:hypothetical protein